MARGSMEHHVRLGAAHLGVESERASPQPSVRRTLASALGQQPYLLLELVGASESVRRATRCVVVMTLTRS